MSKFIQNIENTAMYVNGESWRLSYGLGEVKEEVEASKKGKILLNRSKEKSKPRFQEITEGFYHFTSLAQDSPIYGTLLEDSQETRKKYREIVLFYQSSGHLEKLKKNMREQDKIEFYPIGSMCQGGYNLSAERQTQQITNSCGSFVVPLIQVNKSASITAVFPTPFDKEQESFSYTLFNSQFQIVNQEGGKLAQYRGSKLEKIRFFFLLFSGSSSLNQLQSIVTFEGYLLSNSLSQDVSSQAVISFDCPVSLESEIQILNHDYYANNILG